MVTRKLAVPNPLQKQKILPQFAEKPKPEKWRHNLKKGGYIMGIWKSRDNDDGSTHHTNY